MRVEEFYERMSKYFVNPSMVWLSVEEARYWGYNVIYYTLAVEPTYDMGVLAVEFDVVNEKLIPIAALLMVSEDRVKDRSFQEISAAVKEVNGFIFSGEGYIGFLIPADEYTVEEVLENAIPRLTERLFSTKVTPIIDGYYFDLKPYAEALQQS